MAQIPGVNSLREICFDTILRSLGEYSVEYLSLLRRNYRIQLPESYLPVVDIFQLEGTMFTQSFEDRLDSIWEIMYRHFFVKHALESESIKNWREYFFSFLVSTICKKGCKQGKTSDMF